MSRALVLFTGDLRVHDNDALARAVAEHEQVIPAFVLDEAHGFACGGTMSIYLEPHGSPPRLFIFGAGHVGRAVTALAKTCGFHVTVVDERPHCVVREELPGADELVCAPMGEAFQQVRIGSESFVVVATPGHVSDFDAVKGALATEARFIGLLGSRRKREALLNILTDEGYSEEQRGRVVTPVGMEIAAETPEEIAVSIVGQLIAERRKRV